jgi:hypothetical protein
VVEQQLLLSQQAMITNLTVIPVNEANQESVFLFSPDSVQAGMTTCMVQVIPANEVRRESEEYN